MLRQLISGPVACSKCSTNQSKKIAMSDSCAHVQRGRCALPNESVVFGMDGPRRRCVADCLAWKDLILASLAGANLLAHTLHVAGCCKEGNRTRARQHRNTSRDKAGCGLNPVYALPLALKDSAEEARTRAPMAPPAISWTFAPSSSSFAFFARSRPTEQLRPPPCSLPQSQPRHHPLHSPPGLEVKRPQAMQHDGSVARPEPSSLARPRSVQASRVALKPPPWARR